MGGHVIAMTALTESRDAGKIALHFDTLNMLVSKHGRELEQFWREHFGYGFDCFTEVEGGYVSRQPSIDSIRNSLVTAAKEARSSGLSTITISEQTNNNKPE